MRGKAKPVPYLIVPLFFILVSLVVLLATESKAGVTLIGGLSYEKKAQIGETYQGTILLNNHGDEPQEVRIYQTDYLFFCDGTNKYDEPGKIERSNANWITFSPHRLTIPPRQISTVNYTIEVPNDKPLVGTYWSMLMVEILGKGDPEAMLKPEKDKIQMGIMQVTRYGVQIVTQVDNTGTRKLKFIGTKLLAKEGGGRFLQIDVENIGERWLRPEVWLELYNEEGRYIGKFEGTRMRIYPGTSIRQRIDLSDVPSGKYKTLVVADCGGDYVFGAQYTLKF